MVILNNKTIKIKKFTGKILYNTYCIFYKNNKEHRYYGPAIIFINGGKSWYFNNSCYGHSDDYYNQKQFIKDVNNQ